jgi:uncharacterized protein (UPF0264 family)
MGATMNLLVSVRSAEEAVAALAGGAGLIDVKEPERGALGFAGGEVIAAVLCAVGGRRPVSAALGELRDATPSFPRSAWERTSGRSASCPGRDRDAERRHLRSHAERGSEMAFAKWGLAGCGHHFDWPDQLAQAATLLPAGCRPVAVAYADWQRAAAPPPADVCAATCSRSWGALLIDTWGKDGSTLLDWLSLEAIRDISNYCRAAGVPLALAGSLGIDQIRQLRPLRPDWFAVRGAACRHGRRTQPIDAERVRQLVDLLAEPITAATGAD